MQNSPIVKFSFVLAFVFGFYLMLTAQSMRTRMVLGEEYAKRQLHKVVSDSILSIPSNPAYFVVKEKANAFSIAEATLFRIYGTEQIVRQRPYEAYLINHYWVIRGTIPMGTVGGTFLVIMDALNGKIIKVTHTKG